MPNSVFNFSIPTPSEARSFSIDNPGTMVFLGANGSGKTRLGAHIEHQLNSLETVHRIGAHRSLVLNPNQSPIAYATAHNNFMYGHPTTRNRRNRWGNKPATALISDFDRLIQTLYSEEFELSTRHRQSHRIDQTAIAPETRLDVLRDIWSSILPHRKLNIGGSTITVEVPGTETQYDASDLSDGERVMMYLIGQCLLVKQNSLVIVDEPELHVHKAVLNRLWDKIETQRNDCTFLYLTHDLEFAKSRTSAEKYIVSDFDGANWNLRDLPESEIIPEDVLSKILGSRKNILFVEGDGGSIDANIYREIYTEFTVIPMGSCSNVIQSANAFQAIPELHHLTCAGLIDRDGRTDSEVQDLQSKAIYVLPVTEMENVLLLPSVFEKICQLLQFNASQTLEKKSLLEQRVIDLADQGLEQYSIRASKRRIVEKLRSLTVEGSTLADLQNAYEESASEVNPSSIYSEVKQELASLIESQDFVGVVSRYDNKELVTHCATLLGQKKKSFTDLVVRALGNEDGQDLRNELEELLPVITSTIGGSDETEVSAN